MKQYSIIIALLIGGIIYLSDVINTPPSPAAEPMVPNINFTPIASDTMLSTHTFEGKTVLINFWATWCAPCVIEFPLLVAFAKQHEEQLVLLFVSVDKQAEEAQAFAEKYHALGVSNIHVIWDEDKRISQDTFQTIRYPETLWIGPDLRIKEKLVGMVSEETLAQIAETL